MDWEGKFVAPPQPVCSTSGQALLPGERVFSALLLREGHFQRQDFSASAWQGVDRQPFVSWWRRTLPRSQQGPRRLSFNAATLSQLFANLTVSRHRLEQCLAYIVALALLRARKLRFIETRREDGGDVLILADVKQNLIHRLRDPGMSPQEQDQVLDDLLRLAGTQGEGEGEGEDDKGAEAPEGSSTTSGDAPESAGEEVAARPANSDAAPG